MTLTCRAIAWLQEERVAGAGALCGSVRRAEAIERAPRVADPPRRLRTASPVLRSRVCRLPQLAAGVFIAVRCVPARGVQERPVLPPVHARLCIELIPVQTASPRHVPTRCAEHRPRLPVCCTVVSVGVSKVVEASW